MTRGRDLIGLSVLAEPLLKRIGLVREILLSLEPLLLCGLVLERGGWFQPQRILDAQAVKGVGASHLLVYERYLTGEQKTRCSADLFGLPVLSASGEEMGVLDDVYMSIPGGRITALQLSRGLVDDLWMGKPVISLSSAVRVGEAALVLHDQEACAGGAER